MPYVLTPLAKADIFDIWSYIADDNEDAADRVEQAIYDACAFVAEAPMRGHCRPDLTTRFLRFWTVTRYPNYAVLYRPETAPLEIVAVMHGKRNIRRILQGAPVMAPLSAWLTAAITIIGSGLGTSFVGLLLKRKFDRDLEIQRAFLTRASRERA